MFALPICPYLKPESGAPATVGLLKPSPSPHLGPHLAPHVTPHPINMPPQATRSQRSTTPYQPRPSAPNTQKLAPFILDTFQKTKKVTPRAPPQLDTPLLAATRLPQLSDRRGLTSGGPPAVVRVCGLSAADADNKEASICVMLPGTGFLCCDVNLSD